MGEETGSGLNAKQQRYLEKINSFATPSAPQDIQEIAKSSGYFLCTPCVDYT